MVDQRHIEAVDFWSTVDAAMAANGQHAHGYQASIRMRLIENMETISFKEKSFLYNSYLKKLGVKYFEITGRYLQGTMPKSIFD